MFKLIKIQLEFFASCKRCFLLWKLTFSVASSPLFFIKRQYIFASLQKLFPSLKIVIFCRIVPLLSPHAPPLTMRRPRGEYEMKAPGKICTRANADSLFENRHFLTHRPPIISPCSPLTMRTCSPLTMRRPPPIGSPHRGILCVGKIGSVAP